MNILDIVDLAIPIQTVNVDFFTVDPETLSFVSFGAEIDGTDNTGKIIPVYVITTENITELTLSVSSSENIISKIDSGVKIISNFFALTNNNTITINNVQQNTPYRITIFVSIKDDTYSYGDLELIWSY